MLTPVVRRAYCVPRNFNPRVSTPPSRLPRLTSSCMQIGISQLNIALRSMIMSRKSGSLYDHLPSGISVPKYKEVDHGLFVHKRKSCYTELGPKYQVRSNAIFSRHLAASLEHVLFFYWWWLVRSNWRIVRARLCSSGCRPICHETACHLSATNISTRKAPVPALERKSRYVDHQNAC